jgi:putative PIN family toxin of toxin-antitoxin system
MINIDDVVLDTNILVSALWTGNGNPAKVMKLVTDDEVIAYYNAEIVEEYRNVLFRDKFKVKFSHGEINRLIGYIVEFGKSVDAPKSNIPMPDEDDRPFYDVAKASAATLVTGNIDDFPAEKFIMKPAEYMQMREKLKNQA